MRTLFQPGRDRFLKCSLHVRLTNCVRKNAWYELESAVGVSRLLSEEVGILGETFPALTLMAEPGFVTADFRDQPREARMALQEAFGLILRQTPAWGEGETPLLAAALFADSPSGDAPLEREVMRLARHRGLSREAAAQAWFEAYLEHLVFSGAQAQRLYGWLAGGLQGRGWAHVGRLLPWALGGLALSLGTARWLNLMHLEDSVARSLGGAVTLLRLGFVTLAVALTAAAVAIAGPVGFVGLIVAHMARLLVGPELRRQLIVSPLCGALLVLAADLIGRLVLVPAELPIGVVTSLLGVPFFLVLLARRH